MSEKNLKVGARVDITGKDLQGVVAYVGMTSFAVGKWVGVILDEPKGKNNGAIKGQQYFECGENFGMFVRPTQLRVIAAAPGGGSPEQTKQSNEDIANVQPPSMTQPTKTRLSTSRTSLSSSRQSLLGSRTQLATTMTERSGSTMSTSSVGRKTLQTTSSKEAIPGVAGNSDLVTASGGSHTSSKRASFVETGFLEILKPQFTPSQPMRSPSFTGPPTGTGGMITTLSSAEEKAAAIEQQKLIDDLKGQVADLTEKLETVKQRRSEDKERLREFDKMKIQFEQLQEFRSKIMAAQASLQKELQRAKQETKDAIEARERHAQEMADLSDNVEMITLDKEMAEEKADTLQLELDTTKERVEELQVDLDLLRSEMQNKADATIGGTIGGASGDSIGSGIVSSISIFEFKQLEQQNIRLKETLVRLRDLSAHDKHDIQKLSKELDMKKSEVAELERTKEKLSAKIDDLETTIGDLQEQVDAALGAEEMVEQLAEKKMELEDRVKMLEDEVAQLEALEEVHEQLVESNHDLEMDLREELDMMNGSKKELMRERDAAIETIYDRDQTIIKFRELVQKLNEQLLEMRDRGSAMLGNKSLTDVVGTATVGDKIGGNESGAIDYKQMFAESKAYTRAIDVQLRQIELTQANEHVQMLTAFMPESFMNRGGDHDSILVILLISRIVFKCGIVVSQTRERFPPVDQVTREGVIQGHAVQQYAFKCRLMHYIHNLQCALHQILYGLNSCQPDTLLRAGNSLPEMIAQEKTVDAIIELLKSNQLDENSSTDNIEKCVAFFNAMNSVLLAGEDLVNETQMVRDCVAALASSCEAILNDVAVARVIVREGSAASDTTLLLQFLSEQMEAMRQQVKLIRRRLPQDTQINKCGVSPHKLEGMRQLTQSLSRIMSAMHQATKLTVHAIISGNRNGISNAGEPSGGGGDNADSSMEQTLPHGKFWDLLTMACEHVYEQDDRGPMHNFKSVLGQANSDLQALGQYLLDKEYEIMSSANTKQQLADKAIAPILLRAQFIKKQLEQKNVLAATLENREGDIKQLKLAAKLKQSELSEMQIRKDLAEKKLSLLQKEFEYTVDKWKKQYEEACDLVKQKEKEFEDTMDHLQSDIEALETEKSSLREKLKSSGGGSGSGKRGISASSGDTSLTGSPSRGVAGSGLSALHSAAAAAGGGYAGHQVGAMPLIGEELQLLKTVFNNERNIRLRLQAQQIREKLNKFDPIHVPQPKDKRILELESELTKMKHAWALSLLQTPSVHTAPQSNGQQPHTIAMQRRHQIPPGKMEISTRTSQLAAEILGEYLSRHPHRAASCEFASFPTVEVKRMLKI